MRVPKSLILITGVVAGAVTRSYISATRRRIESLERSVGDLSSRLAEASAANQGAHEQVAARLDEHEARLAEMPTAEKIAGAVEELLGKTMSCLDQRLAAQADSIEVLRTTVSQTDQLLERVLNSLDALQRQGGSHPVTAER